MGLLGAIGLIFMAITVVGLFVLAGNEGMPLSSILWVLFIAGAVMMYIDLRPNPSDLQPCQISCQEVQYNCIPSP